MKWRDLLKSEPLGEPPAPGLEDTAILQYTGGTTGIPKAAILSHRNIMSNVAQINAWLPQMRYGTERVVGLIPFFHVFGLTVCLNWPVSQGAEVIMLPRFEVDMFLKMLKQKRPTILPGVPTLFVALLNRPELPQVDLSDMWACVSGFAPLPLEVREKFEALANCRIIEGFGLKFALAYNNRGDVWRAKGELDNALKDYDEALRLNPKFAEAYNNRAWLRATAANATYRYGTQSVDDATKACELSGWKDDSYIDTLAAAYAENGDFPNAITYLTQAMEMAPTRLPDQRHQMLDLFRSGKPFRE